MKNRTEGRFDVTRTAEPPYDHRDGVLLARSRFDKRFEGGLVGTSIMNMTSAGSNVKGSAGYVGIERFDGELDGRAGSFVMQHNGIMDRGNPSLVITVVPDTGTGALVGLRGKMTIDMSTGDHRFIFEYDFIP